MGQATDFTYGINVIRDAHADSVAVLEKWRSLLTASGEVSLLVKEGSGAREIVLPSIREAINRYLGGTFEQITLTDGTNTVIIRLNRNGYVELVDGDELPAGLIAPKIAATSISGENGRLQLIGEVSLSNASISQSNIDNLVAETCQIKNSQFNGATTFTGNTTITGNATIRNATVRKLDAGSLVYSKQVMAWEVEGIIDEQMLGQSNNGLWVGDPAKLERAGIFPEPTWCDCAYIPVGAIGGTDTVYIYWGATGDTRIQRSSGVYDFRQRYMASWPYKMYEKVGDAYRIRWLPLNDQLGRIAYVRTGNLAADEQMAGYVTETINGESRTVMLGTTYTYSAYSCRRHLADVDSVNDYGIITNTHIMYRM